MALDKKDESEDRVKNFLESFCGIQFVKNKHGLFYWRKTGVVGGECFNGSETEFNTLPEASADAWGREVDQAICYHEIQVESGGGANAPEWKRLSIDEQENLVKESTFMPVFATKSDFYNEPIEGETNAPGCHILDEWVDEYGCPTLYPAPMARSPRMG